MATMKGVEWLMHSQSDTAAQLGNALGAVFAILNGFYWNRRWTFRAGHTADAGAQFVRFGIVSLIGLALNASLFHVFLVRQHLFRGYRHADLACQVITISCVVIWNFSANTFWTFRRRRPADLRG
jgi:putative flippase GtrA